MIDSDGPWKMLRRELESRRALRVVFAASIVAWMVLALLAVFGKVAWDMAAVVVFFSAAAWFCGLWLQAGARWLRGHTRDALWLTTARLAEVVGLVGILVTQSYLIVLATLLAGR